MITSSIFCRQMFVGFALLKSGKLAILKISGENNGRAKCSSRIAAIIAEALVRDNLDFKIHSIKVDSQAPCKRTQHCSPSTPNIVGCHMLRPFAHPVACCWILLRVVAQSLKPVKLFSQQLPTFLLFRDRRSVAQQCWIRLHIVDYKDLWVVFFPRCTAGPKLVGSCCIRLHTTANTQATTPNIVAPTMLGVVASVCTQPQGRYNFLEAYIQDSPYFILNIYAPNKCREKFLGFF